VHGIKKYIAIVLLGTFGFPPLFQSFHIVWHHSPLLKGNHHLYHAEAPTKHLPKDEITLSKLEKRCPICDYRFSMNSLPGLSLFKTIIPVVTGHQEAFNIGQPPQLVIRLSSTRGPPVLG
jgi:hypothetical protein